MAADRDGQSCPVLWPGACDFLDKGTWHPSRLRLVLLGENGQWCFAGGYATPTLDACGGIDCLSTCITDFYIEYVALYYGTLTLYGKCYGTYVCIPD
jgi:hypothetical protein